MILGLQVPVVDEPSQRCLSPKCQCSSFSARKEAKLVTVRVPIGKRKRKKKDVKVPRWVARSKLAKDSFTACSSDLVDIKPRYAVEPIVATRPGLQGVKGFSRVIKNVLQVVNTCLVCPV